MLIGPSAVNATPPGWEYLYPKQLPPVVTLGQSAGFSFTIHNGGKSNISQLYLTDSVVAVPSYFSNSRGTVCTLDPDLFCSFGALNSDETIDVVIAYATPTSGTKFDITFQLNSSGNTFSDGAKGTSHGDTKEQFFSTALSSSRNFAGGFTIDGTVYANDADLGPKNIQAGTVTPPTSFIPVTLEDGLADNAFSCGTLTECANRFGEWTRLNVANGSPFASGFKVVITVLGSKVPNGATVDTIDLIHVPDVGAPYTISARCTGDGLNAGGVECISVLQVGRNFQIIAWLISNGGARSAF